MTVGAVQANGAADRPAPAPAPLASPSPGVVELREDVPLKGYARAPGGGGAAPWCADGPRLVIVSFAALTAAITLALFTQIYYGDFEVVPHGSVSSDAAACSAAGTAALKAGGRAFDAGAVTALCLAIVAPHRTSLDASGAMLYWEYRAARSAAATTSARSPSAAEWGGAGARPAGGLPRPPRLVAALAALHAELGALPWARLLQPAIDLAKNGFEVSEGLAAAFLAHTPGTNTSDTALPSVLQQSGYRPGPLSTASAPEIAAYLESLQNHTSAEVAAMWGGDADDESSGWLRRSAVPAAAAGARRLYAAGLGAPHAARALARALDPAPVDLDEASTRVLVALQQEADVSAASDGAWPPAAGGAAAGVAVVDAGDTYLALVTGTSEPFGSGPRTEGGWRRDDPPHELDLAPAIMVDGSVCGTRFVLGAESTAALAQAGATLGAGGGAAGVEHARAALGAGGVLAAEAGRAAPPTLGVLVPLGAPPVPPPHAAVNVVQQTADALLSHADSRGGGLSSRF